jgi:hypothetical protein
MNLEVPSSFTSPTTHSIFLHWTIWDWDLTDAVVSETGFLDSYWRTCIYSTVQLSRSRPSKSWRITLLEHTGIEHFNWRSWLNIDQNYVYSSPTSKCSTGSRTYTSIEHILKKRVWLRLFKASNKRCCVHSEDVHRHICERSIMQAPALQRVWLK